MIKNLPNLLLIGLFGVTAVTHAEEINLLDRCEAIAKGEYWADDIVDIEYCRKYISDVSHIRNQLNTIGSFNFDKTTGEAKVEENFISMQEADKLIEKMIDSLRGEIAENLQQTSELRKPAAATAPPVTPSITPEVSIDFLTELDDDVPDIVADTDAVTPPLLQMAYLGQIRHGGAAVHILHDLSAGKIVRLSLGEHYLAMRFSQRGNDYYLGTHRLSTTAVATPADPEEEAEDAEEDELLDILSEL